MDIKHLINRLTNPSEDPADNHDAMAHAAKLIELMQDRIHYLADTNIDLREKNDRLSLDLGLKDQGYIK
jgi:hypothetical protein